MAWEDQSAAHKFIKRGTVVIANITFAMPALTSLLLLSFAILGWWKHGRWETPSLMRFLRDLNPDALAFSRTSQELAAATPLWLACLTLTLLVFAWSMERKYEGRRDRRSGKRKGAKHRQGSKFDQGVIPMR